MCVYIYLSLGMAKIDSSELANCFGRRGRAMVFMI
jgi:hypothetical protein